MKSRWHLLHGIFVALAAASFGAKAADLPSPATPKQSNQIWECTTNGLRTFSSNPCGAKSTVRQLNQMNVMQPAPEYHPNYQYAPPQPAGRNTGSTPDGVDESNQDTLSAVYPVYIVPRSHRARVNAAHNHLRSHHR